MLEHQLIRKPPDRTLIESCPFFLARWPNRANVSGTKPGVLPQAIVSLTAGQPFIVGQSLFIANGLPTP